jgi:predicted RNA-binding Zn-ribbon protein involved in translation (DUF1610 family)
MRCTSCGSELDKGSVVLECPKCDNKIARCGKCRNLSIKYKCKCGFEGP